MALNDEVADALRARTLRLLRVDLSERKRVLELLWQLRGELVEKIARTDFGRRTATQQRRLEELLKTTNQSIRATYTTIAKTNQDTLVELSKVEGQWIADTINGGAGVEIATVPAVSQLRALVRDTLIEGSPAAEWWSKQAGDLQFRFQRTMRQSILQGLNLREMRQRVRLEVFDPGARHATALVRTAYQAQANAARMATYEVNSDVIRELMWVSTIDLRTSKICLSLSGLRWDAKTLEPIGHSKKFQRPPAHFNCRSILVPVTASWRDLGYDIDELDPGTRASMDGQVPEDITMDAWLKKRTKSEQEKLLGRKRAELFRKGRLKLRDLTDSTGRPLRLDEL